MENPPAIHQLSPADLDFARKLSQLAGWNQTQTDWRRLLEMAPRDCFLATTSGCPAGTATTTDFSGDIAWIGMVLVHPEFRRQGLATCLMKECLDRLGRQVRCIKLDATPVGMEVYGRLGFAEEFRLARWQGIAPGSSSPKPTASRLDEAQFHLDQVGFGADRSDFLRRLAADSERVVLGPDGAYGMIRRGEKAFYLGPVVARDPETGKTIVEILLGSVQEHPVYWDLPEDNEPAVALAESMGFSRQRELIRMWTGREFLAGSASIQWAISGPETG